MNILFLDIDGVLNSTKSILLGEKATPTELERDFLLELTNTYYKGYPPIVLTADLFGLDKDCIESLNLILETTGAKVVISSSWRYGHTNVGLQKLLENRGFKGEIISSTPVNLVGKAKIRGLEIQSWLNLNHNTDRFVILDDNGGMAHLKKYWVQPSSKVGLTEEDAKKAISILKSKTVRI